MTASAAPPPSARLAFRACGRRLLRTPGDYAQHARRLGLALELPGSEPVQGALADLWVGCREAGETDRRRALDAVRSRLSPLTARAFEQHLAGGLPACTRLATRWSVLATASLDLPARSLCCSTDDSRALAAQAVQAWQDGDEAAQDEFLRHCRVCRDGLAFMLARRAILRRGAELPKHWAAVFTILQERAAS